MSKNPTVAVEKREVGRPQNASTELENWDEDGKCCNTQHLNSLPELEALLEVEVKDWQEIEKNATVRGIRLGVLLLKARSDLKHGQWIPWVKAHVPFDRVKVWRFTRAAESFLTQKRVPLARAYAEIAPKLLPAGDGAQTGDKKRSELVQMVFDFVGGKSWEELCRQLGIPANVRTPPNPDRIAKTPEELRELKAMMARNDWAQIKRLLSHWINDKSFEHLSDLEIDRARDSLKGSLMLLPKLVK
jgi:hypothetical protein